MTDHHHRCSNCGATMKPHPDGRTHACEFCGHQHRVAVDANALAAGIRLDLANAEAFLEQLAHELHGSFRHASKLEKEGGQLHLFELNLDPDLFVARREAHGMVHSHRKLVRGVALKTSTLPLDRWVEMLARALAKHADENARVAQVLAQLRVS